MRKRLDFYKKRSNESVVWSNFTLYHVYYTPRRFTGSKVIKGEYLRIRDGAQAYIFYSLNLGRKI